MRTYSRACKKRKTGNKAEDVFFAENAFRSPMDIPRSTENGNKKAPRNEEHTPLENFDSSKRKQQELATKQTQKKAKKMNDKEPDKKTRQTNKRGRGRGHSINKDIEKKVVVSTKALPVDTVTLPVMDVTCLDKVNSWLEGCVEDDASSLHSSIELWRGEEITGSGREKSLFPEEFYKNLRAQNFKEKDSKGKKKLEDEKEEFFSKLQMRLQGSPVRKTSNRKSSRTTIEATESEGLTYSYMQSGTQTCSELFKMDAQSKSQSGSKVNETETHSTTYLPESQMEIETQSTPQTGTTQCETGTQRSTQYSTQSSLKQKKMVSKTATSRGTLSSQETPDKPTGFKPPRPPKKSDKIVQPKTSTRLYEEDSMWIEEPFPAVSTIQFETGRQKIKVQEKSSSKKIKAIYRDEGIKMKDKEPPEPKTSTKLFTTTVCGMEATSPGLSTISPGKGATAKRLLLQEKTPDKPIEVDLFKPPRRVGAKGKRTQYPEPKTSTRLFHTDTVDIEDAFPAMSSIRNEEENKDFISPEKYNAPVTTSTPNDKHPTGQNFRFEMDISSVNQDSGDRSVGLHFEHTTRELNSEEIVPLSQTHISTSQCQNSLRRKPSKTLRYSSSLPNTETLVKTRLRVMASTDRKRSINLEQLQKVDICPLITMKCSEVKHGLGSCRLKFTNPPNECIDHNGVPDDILGTL